MKEFVIYEGQLRQLRQLPASQDTARRQGTAAHRPESHHGSEGGIPSGLRGGLHKG